MANLNLFLRLKMEFSVFAVPSKVLPPDITKKFLESINFLIPTLRNGIRKSKGLLNQR